MSSYVIHDTKLRHDGGYHNLEVEIDGDQAVIRFGASFTLRLDEKSIDQLRDILYDTSREITAQRYDRRYNERLAEVEADTVADESLEENLSEQQKVDLWDMPPNDEVTGYPV